MHRGHLTGLRYTDMRHQRLSKKDSCVREPFDLTPVHSNGILRLIQGTKMCTGIKQNDSGAQYPGLGTQTRQTHVHRGHLTELRYTDMRHQRLSKKDSCARGLSDMTPAHSNGILRPIQGTKMCTGIKQNDSGAQYPGLGTQTR